MPAESSNHWIDVSVPIEAGMVHWPGDPPVRIDRAQSIARGDAANVSHLDMGAHTGTHMDAPVHFIEDGAGIDSMPFEATIGRARVIRAEDPTAIDAPELAQHEPRRGERLLFRTRNSQRAPWEGKEFDPDFIHISTAGAQFLSERGVRTVGVDYLSVGGFRRGGAETHRALLEAGIWIIEGLDLSAIEPGLYELVCLPLRISGSDGAPARALLRALDTDQEGGSDERAKARVRRRRPRQDGRQSRRARPRTGYAGGGEHPGRGPEGPSRRGDDRSGGSD